MKNKLFLSIVIAFTFFANAFAEELPNTTSIDVTFETNISNANAYTNGISGVITHDIIANGKVLIKKGTIAKPSDLVIEKPKAVGRPGEISFTRLLTTSVDNQTIYLATNFSKSGKKIKGKVLGISLGIGITICWPVLFYLFKKGGEANIPAGTTIACTTDRNYNIEVQ